MNTYSRNQLLRFTTHHKLHTLTNQKLAAISDDLNTLKTAFHQKDTPLIIYIIQSISAEIKNPQISFLITPQIPFLTTLFTINSPLLHSQLLSFFSNFTYQNPLASQILYQNGFFSSLITTLTPQLFGKILNVVGNSASEVEISRELYELLTFSQESCDWQWAFYVFCLSCQEWDKIAELAFLAVYMLLGRNLSSRQQLYVLNGILAVSEVNFEVLVSLSEGVILLYGDRQKLSSKALEVLMKLIKQLILFDFEGMAGFVSQERDQAWLVEFLVEFELAGDAERVIAECDLF